MKRRSESSLSRLSRKRTSTLALAGALATIALATPRQAHAQAQTFSVDRLVLAGAPDDGIGVWRPEMGDKSRFFGQFALGFALNPFRLENEIVDPNNRAKVASDVGTPLNWQILTYYDAGFEVLKRFSVQAEFPLVLGEHGHQTNDASVREAADVVSPDTVAPGDLRLDVRVKLFENETHVFKLGAQAAVWVPTGDKLSYMGDKSASTGLFLAGELDFKKVFFDVNAGFHFRPDSGVNSFKVGDEFTYAVGAFVPFRGDSARLGAELFGSIGIANQDAPKTNANAPLEWMAEGRFWMNQKKSWYLGGGGGTRLDACYSPDLRLMALIGGWFTIADTNPPAPGKRFKAWDDHGADSDHDGIPDDIDLCPNDPEDHKPPNPDDGCPALPDRDGDGIPDISDKCPDQPEDFDGIQDADGCPEDDADKDGIPDAQDACPLEPGEPSPDPKKNGCPQFIRRIKGSSEIELLKNIEFETGKATILKKSYPIVDEVARLLKVNADIKHLDIEGHTDNKGSDELNQKLSNDRANSVMQYLIDHGIEKDRLAAQGYGPKRPIADNATAEGRQRNRRVEFHIRGGAGPNGPQTPGAPPAPPGNPANDGGKPSAPPTGGPSRPPT